MKNIIKVKITKHSIDEPNWYSDIIGAEVDVVEHDVNYYRAIKPISGGYGGILLKSDAIIIPDEVVEWECVRDYCGFTKGKHYYADFEGELKDDDGEMRNINGILWHFRKVVDELSKVEIKAGEIWECIKNVADFFTAGRKYESRRDGELFSDGKCDVVIHKDHLSHFRKVESTGEVSGELSESEINRLSANVNSVDMLKPELDKGLLNVFGDYDNTKPLFSKCRVCGQVSCEHTEEYARQTGQIPPHPDKPLLLKDYITYEEASRISLFLSGELFACIAKIHNALLPTSHTIIIDKVEHTVSLEKKNQIEEILNDK